MGTPRQIKSVFCEYQFLLNFIDSYPKDVLVSDDGISRMKIWISIFNFLMKSELILDINIKELNESSYDIKSSIIKKIKKRSTTVGVDKFKLEFLGSQLFPYAKSLKEFDIDEVMLNSIFLTTLDDIDCKKISNKYGILVLNLNLIFKSQKLFHDSGIPFPHESRDWDFLDLVKIGASQINICNSITIIDSYILSDNIIDGKKLFSFEEKIEYNIRPILTSIIPESLSSEMELQITVISGSAKGKKKNESFSNQYNKLKDVVQSICQKRNIKFNLSVYYDWNDSFHDRVILTNYLWIGCGHGFDIFKSNNKKCLKPTSVNVIFPFLQSTIDWCDKLFIKNIRKVEVNKTAHDSIRKVWGDKDQFCYLEKYYAGDTDYKECKMVIRRGSKRMKAIDNN